jgi:predicted O-methyltransferase YrrM
VPYRSGKVTSVDVADDAGSMIPANLMKKVTLINADAMTVLENAEDESLDFIFEDTDHSYETGVRTAELAQLKLRPGGFLVVHDAVHFLVGRDIRNGLLAGHIVPEFYKILPSDCGLAIWRKPLPFKHEDELSTLSSKDQKTKVDD